MVAIIIGSLLSSQDTLTIPESINSNCVSSPVPQAPTSVTIEADSRTPNSVNVSWDHFSDSSDEPQGFSINFVPFYNSPMPKAVEANQAVATGSGTKSFVLQNLEPNSSYLVSVAAFNSDGTSPQPGDTSSANAPRKLVGREPAEVS